MDLETSQDQDLSFETYNTVGYIQFYPLPGRTFKTAGETQNRVVAVVKIYLFSIKSEVKSLFAAEQSYIIRIYTHLHSKSSTNNNISSLQNAENVGHYNIALVQWLYRRF